MYNIHVTVSYLVYKLVLNRHMDTILSIVIISISVLIVTVLWTMWYQEGSLNFVHASLFPLVVLC